MPLQALTGQGYMEWGLYRVYDLNHRDPFLHSPLSTSNGLALSRERETSCLIECKIELVLVSKLFCILLGNISHISPI